MSDDLTLPPPADPTAGGAGDNDGEAAEAAPLTMAEILARKTAPERRLPIVVDGQLVTFVFRAMPPDEFEALRMAHPPTRQQIDRYEQRARELGVPTTLIGGLMWNPDTFPAELIAASCAEPVVTLDEAKAMWTSGVFSEGELEALTKAAWDVNHANLLGQLGNV